MELHCLGLNHKTASLDLLEKVHFTDEQTRAALARCGCGRDQQLPDLLELTLLSTCNRVELYAVLPSSNVDPMREILAESAGLGAEAIDPHLYHYRGLGAVRHLLEVAAGLDSMVVGEPQILGQVAQAHAASLKAGASGALLNKVFHAAIHAGKRARSESGIATNPATTSSVAVEFIASVIPRLGEASVLVLGAGEMAELAVEALRKRGSAKITVINRTVARARQLADRWQAEARAYEQLGASLAEVDILISSTGAPHIVVHRETVEEAMSRRPDRPLVLIDIAVPRDVDPEVAELPNVHLFDLDTLDETVDSSLEMREREIPKVERILHEEIESFRSWYDSLSVRPLIAELHQQAEAIRTRELARTLSELPDLAPEDRERIEAMSRALMKKLLHGPTLRLKEHSRNGSAAAYALVTRDLFNLPSEGKSGGQSQEPSP